MATKIVQVGMPLRGTNCHYVAAMGHLLWPSKRADVKVQPTFASCSLLTLSFNLLWAEALTGYDRGLCTHFAMLHDDVCPQAGWIDTLLAEQEEYDADIVSAVVPIKDGRGVTSTALEVEDYWNPKRLTLAEVFDREETFTDPAILLNTGCWLCPLDRAWCKHVHFTIDDRVWKDESGRWRAEVSSEDWNFSRMVRAAGGSKLYATRKVALDHERPEFTNRAAWGSWTTDEVYANRSGGRATTTEAVAPKG